MHDTGLKVLSWLSTPGLCDLIQLRLRPQEDYIISIVLLYDVVVL